MIQTILVFGIRCYQRYISIILKSLFGCQALCRNTPSCSEYAMQAIQRHGAFVGCFKFLVRLLHCQPYASVRNRR